MGAIDKAKEILAKGVTEMVQRGPDDDTGDDAGQDETRKQLESLLEKMGKQFHSYAMMEMVSAAAYDPFSKVKGLIEDMISKLMQAAAEEANHKAFCDEELGKSRKAKAEKAMKMDQYRARIDSSATSKAELEDAIK